MPELAFSDCMCFDKCLYLPEVVGHQWQEIEGSLQPVTASGAFENFSKSQLVDNKGLDSSLL